MEGIYMGQPVLLLHKGKRKVYNNFDEAVYSKGLVEIMFGS